MKKSFLFLRWLFRTLTPNMETVWEEPYDGGLAVFRTHPRGHSRQRNRAFGLPIPDLFGLFRGGRWRFVFPDV